MITADDHQFAPDSDSLSFPDDTVVAIVDEPKSTFSAVDELVASGVPKDTIQVMCCEPGARRLDPSGERHGTLGKLHRVIQHFGDKEVAHVKRQASELEAGKFLIAAGASDDTEAERVAGILAAHGGHFINHYTGMAVRTIRP